MPPEKVSVCAKTDIKLILCFDTFTIITIVYSFIICLISISNGESEKRCNTFKTTLC